MEFEVRKIEDSRQKWEEGRPILRGIGMMLLAVGAFFLASGLYGGAKKYWRIGQWTIVDAQVLDFNVVPEHCGRASNCYRAYFTFRYAVQGRKLIAGTQSDHQGSYSSEMSNWKGYQRGSQQQIRYNPAQPEEIMVDSLNLRSFREPLKLGGWGAGLVLIGFMFRR